MIRDGIWLNVYVDGWLGRPTGMSSGVAAWLDSLNARDTVASDRRLDGGAPVAGRAAGRVGRRAGLWLGRGLRRRLLLLRTRGSLRVL